MEVEVGHEAPRVRLQAPPGARVPVPEPRGEQGEEERQPLLQQTRVGRSDLAEPDAVVAEEEDGRVVQGAAGVQLLQEVDGGLVRCRRPLDHGVSQPRAPVEAEVREVPERPRDGQGVVVDDGDACGAALAERGLHALARAVPDIPGHGDEDQQAGRTGPRS